MCLAVSGQDIARNSGLGVEDFFMVYITIGSKSDRFLPGSTPKGVRLRNHSEDYQTSRCKISESYDNDKSQSIKVY
jgi:hypothetical protein